MITNIVIYRDRRNENPCQKDDAFSVAVPVEVYCKQYEAPFHNYDVRAEVTENTDPRDLFIQPNPQVESAYIGTTGFNGVRYLFKKGEEIDLTPEETKQVIELYEDRKREETK